MQLNGYPEALVTKTIKRTLLYQNKTKNTDTIEKPKLFMPYEKGISDQLKLNLLLINMV